MTPGQVQASFFSSRSLAHTARTWGSNTSAMRTVATVRRQSDKAPPLSSQQFLYPPRPPRARTLVAGKLKIKVAEHIPSHTAMRDLVSTVRFCTAKRAQHRISPRAARCIVAGDDG